MACWHVDGCTTDYPCIQDHDIVVEDGACHQSSALRDFFPSLKACLIETLSV